MPSSLVPTRPPRPATRPSSHGLRKLLVLSAAAIVSSCAQLPSVEDAEARQRAELAEQARQAARPSSICSAAPGSPFAFKKKIAVLNMPLTRPTSAADLPGISSQWSNALQQQLNASQRFLVRDGSRYQLDPGSALRQQLATLAQQLDAQFIIAGRIESLHTSRGQLTLGPLKPLPLPHQDKRLVVTAIDIFDGGTGSLIKTLSYEDEVQGSIDNRGTTLQRDFFTTPFGAAIGKMLERQREDIEDELACLPMQARIVRMLRHEAQIDAGFSSNIVPGDRLKIYRSLGNTNISSIQVNRGEEMLGELLIRKVFPESSSGHIDGPVSAELESGGYVRAW